MIPYTVTSGDGEASPKARCAAVHGVAKNQTQQGD